MVGTRAFCRTAHAATCQRRQIWKFFVAVQTSNFFHKILFDFDIKAVGGTCHNKIGTFSSEFKAKARKGFGHEFVGNVNTDDLAATIRTHANHANSGQIDALIVNGTNAGLGRTANFEHKLSNVIHVLDIRSPVNTTFEAISGIGREIELTATALDGHLLPEGGFDKHIDRIIAD